MSILATSPTSTRHFDMNIAAALGDINAAIIVQQLHYWMQKEGVGVKIDGVKYIYNTFVDWVNSQFSWLSVWQFRKAMSLLRSLGIVKVIRYKSKQWNQTNYYHLDGDRLVEFLNREMSRSTETKQMCSTSSQGEGNLTFEVRDPLVSYIETKNTNQKETAKQSAAALSKLTSEKENSQKNKLSHSTKLLASSGANKAQSELSKSNIGKDKSSAQVDFIVNKTARLDKLAEHQRPSRSKWQELVPLLDGAGIPINKTVTDLLKLYSSQKVENAVALLKARKREQHIPNLSGYFVAALKGDWGSKTLIESESKDGNRQIDTAAVFRHWYDLARELGYCSGQEIRQGEQWICLSGAWEKWADAMKRGYSLEYLKKIMKRNKGN